jgi:hypothetical protein
VKTDTSDRSCLSVFTLAITAPASTLPFCYSMRRRNTCSPKHSGDPPALLLSCKSLTVMFVETIHERSHLIIPQLDRSIMQRSSQQRLFRVCIISFLSFFSDVLIQVSARARLTECDALYPRAFAFKLPSALILRILCILRFLLLLPPLHHWACRIHQCTDSSVYTRPSHAP